MVVDWPIGNKGKSWKLGGRILVIPRPVGTMGTTSQLIVRVLENWSNGSSIEY